MANDYHEKDYDDEVYEDQYYDEHYDEEELEEDGEDIVDETKNEVRDEELESDDIEDWDNEKRVTVSFACEECDYRWDDVIIKKKDKLEEDDDYVDTICPMCGSMNVTLI
jgi:hypothetical protein